MTQLHPLRMFYPGQTYKPEELVHTPGDSTALPLHRPTLKVHRTQRRTPAANALLYEQADFRRPQLLSGFTSDTGKLLPRRTTKVAAKVQRKFYLEPLRRNALWSQRHDARDRLMGKDGEKRIIRLALVTLAELGYEHKTDRAVRRAIAYKMRSAPIGFTQVEFDRDDRREPEATG